jgi:hypothetical protein
MTSMVWRSIFTVDEDFNFNRQLDRMANAESPALMF